MRQSRGQPTGTVTFLFSDIEGSTRLLHELGAESYALALDLHRRLLRDTFDRNGGYEVGTEGDAFFVAFASASAAVAAARESQRALAAAHWPEGRPIRVRIGVHTGEPMVDPPNYVGLDVHRAARIMSVAHGGQVVLSQRTHELLGDGFELRDLGEHRLKDFNQPVALFQLGVETFPPLMTVSNTNLPRPISSFVGRAEEVRELTALIGEGARLVTLTGPGGTGKTRLAVEAASELVAAFKAGVFWVPLAAVREPKLITEAIAQSIGARDELVAEIADRQLLLVLDNFEQVVEAAPQLAQLVEGCRNLALLVTSRELLRIRGEVEYPVAPLAESEAVTLFTERAQLEATAEIRELCRRLDNLPLAIELAAARTRLLTPAQILERLSSRLDLFTGTRDADARQATLRATIEWSHDLLTPAEQRLFARLSVFAGGCTLAAAETICGAELDTLQSLVEKSLLRYGEERFWMLETIHQYARECIAGSTELDVVARSHASFYSELARSAETETKRGPAGDREAAMRRIAGDIPNVRAAYAELLEAGDAVDALRLATDISPVLESLASIDEGYALVETALARADTAPAPLRNRARYELAALDNVRGNYDESFEGALEVSRYARSAGDSDLLFQSLVIAGIAATYDDHFDTAGALLEEALAVARSRADGQGEAEIYVNLAELALARGDYGEAETLAERALSAFEAIGYGRDGVALLNLTQARIGRDDTAGAAETLSEALQVSHRLGRRGWVAAGIGLAGVIAAGQGSLERALQFLEAGDALCSELGIVLSGSEARLRADALRALHASPGRASTASLPGTALAESEALEAALAYLAHLSQGP